MSFGSVSTKNKEMAADLRRRGIYHGRRLTAPLSTPIPSINDTGSAAYRRRIAKARS